MTLMRLSAHMLINGRAEWGLRPQSLDNCRLCFLNWCPHCQRGDHATLLVALLVLVPNGVKWSGEKCWCPYMHLNQQLINRCSARIWQTPSNQAMNWQPARAAQSNMGHPRPSSPRRPPRSARRQEQHRLSRGLGSLFSVLLIVRTYWSTRWGRWRMVLTLNQVRARQAYWSQ